MLWSVGSASQDEQSIVLGSAGAKQERKRLWGSLRGTPSMTQGSSSGSYLPKVGLELRPQKTLKTQVHNIRPEVRQNYFSD